MPPRADQVAGRKIGSGGVIRRTTAHVDSVSTRDYDARWLLVLGALRLGARALQVSLGMNKGCAMFGIDKISVYLLASGGLLTLWRRVDLADASDRPNVCLARGIRSGHSARICRVTPWCVWTATKWIKASLMAIPVGAMDMAAESGPRRKRPAAGLAARPGGAPGGGEAGPRAWALRRAARTNRRAI